MLLKGSCHCQKVKFQIETDWYFPIMWCYCSICRKTNGGPISCNIKGRKANLKIKRGKKFVRMYCAEHCERHFCGKCGSSLFILDRRWPRDCWPNAAAIDTKLPKCPKQVHIFVKDLPLWFEIKHQGPKFKRYPKRWIEGWHREMKLT